MRGLISFKEVVQKNPAMTERCLDTEEIAAIAFNYLSVSESHV